MKEGVVMGGINFVTSLVDLNLYFKKIQKQMIADSIQDSGPQENGVYDECEKFIKDVSIFRYSVKKENRIEEERAPDGPDSILGIKWGDVFGDVKKWKFQVPIKPQSDCKGDDCNGSEGDLL